MNWSICRSPKVMGVRGFEEEVEMILKIDTFILSLSLYENIIFYSLPWEQSGILALKLSYKNVENHLASVGASFDDPSRTPMAWSAPTIFTSTSPGGFYNEY
ncbi:hypothetical protein TNCV_945991 [Trichonephila clavipes]|nr:hypothetical protein TNCV_945991 [Trichonephila clavipes]